MAPTDDFLSIQLEFPEWQGVYHSALFETDNTILPALIATAETAIVNRKEALAGDSDHHTERGAMEDALRYLGVLKRERPDWVLPASSPGPRLI